MNCRETQDRLTALHDRELSPGESTQVKEHLRTCLSCRRRAQQLTRVTPKPTLQLPEFAWERLDQALDEAWERPRANPRVPWWRQSHSLSGATILLYAAALFGALLWGVHGWRTQPTPVDPPTVAVPSEDYRPAGWAPEEATP